MPSTFAGIEIGKRGLLTHTQGLYTIGHNMSNASMEGYSRQRVEMSAAEPIYMPALNREERPGQLGQGVEVSRIERIKDMLLEGRLVSETSGEGYWSARDKYVLLLEQIYNEPAELSTRSLMDKFWESWQELSLNPTETGAHRAVLQRGKALLDAIHDRFGRLKETRDMLEADLQARVKQVNSMAGEIAGLNEQIEKSRALGDNPNDLLDRRDLLTSKLAEIVDLSVGTQDPDEYVLYTGGMHLVQGRHFEPMDLEPDPNNEGYSKLVWKGSKEEVAPRGGALAALLELRDRDARGEIQKLDLMTVNFIDLVNEVHRRGTGINGRAGLEFFVEYPFINNLAGNYDRNGDGTFDSSYIFRITGANTLRLKDSIGLQGTLTLSGSGGNVLVDYHPTDTVEDLIKRINTCGAEVAARLNQAGHLTLKGVPAENAADPDFVLRHLEDSGQFLTGYAGLLTQSGPSGAFGWQVQDAVFALRQSVDFAVAPLAHPAGWIQINPELASDPTSIATSLRGQSATGDGSAALAIARLRVEPVMLGLIESFDEYFASVVTDIGLRGEEAGRALETEGLVIKKLKEMKESISGVNLDEELAAMIKYQHGYQAAARFVSEIDRMLDTIINRMGV